MDLGLISVRYARALLKAGIEAKEAEKVYADMQTLAQNYSQMPALRITIDNHMLSNAQKESLLLLATGGEPCELTKRFVALVLKEDRESIMQFIANSFITLYRKHNNLISAKLTTASEIDSKTEDKLRQLVEGRTNGKVDFQTDVDPEIIGGFVLEYDTYRMDASVKKQLNAILSNLNK